MSPFRAMSSRAHRLTARDAAGRVLEITSVGDGRMVTSALHRMAADWGVNPRHIEVTAVTGKECPS